MHFSAAKIIFFIMKWNGDVNEELMLHILKVNCKFSFQNCLEKVVAM